MGKICDICKKNGATVHLKGILNDKTVEIDMCENCSDEKGVELDPGLALLDFINSLPESGRSIAHAAQSSSACKNCGMTLREIKQDGCFGCEKCYTNFSSIVGSLLEHIHGCQRHSGKNPGQKRQADAPDLKARLEKAVRKEEYELAASLRDELRKIKA